MTPPQTGIFIMNISSQCHQTPLVRSQCNGSRQLSSIEGPTKHTLYRFSRMVGQFGINGQPRLFQRLRIYPRADGRMTDGNVATRFDHHLTKQAHALISRARIPVDKTNVRFTELGTKHLHRQHIFLANKRRHIERKLSIRSSHLILVGTIANAVERKQHVLL